VNRLSTGCTKRTSGFAGGIERAVLDPIVADLIRLYDQLSQEARRLAADGAEQRLLRSFADDIAEILDPVRLRGLLGCFRRSLRPGPAPAAGRGALRR